MPPRLTIVSPCYNEEATLPHSANALSAFLERMISLGKVTPESRILFVNDGSQDQTWPIIKELHRTCPYVDGLSLAGNVGSELAIMAGMMQAREYSEAVVTIDSDLQDDLDAVEEMLDRLAEGYDIVYGVKVSRTADPFLKRTTAQAFYRLQQAMGIRMIYNHTNFRLMSRRALEALASTTVDDVIREREAGTSKYNYRKLLLLAVDGITSFSTRPISWIIGMGLAFLLISVCMAVYVVVSYVEHLSVPGWASLMLSLWFIGSILLLSIGVIGQYIGKIYIEIKQRPRYHIAQFLKHNDDDR